MTRQTVPWIAAAACAALLLLTGCSVRVNKSASGDDKDVSIRTPFGGMQVHKDSAGAAAMGLSVYPGAVPRADDGDDKSVNFSMGFGKWQMRVLAANYRSTDPQAKVQTFYTRALGQWGQVLTCRDNQPVGQPTRTSEGLTCSDDNDHGHGVHVDHDRGLVLKAGSPHHQRLVAFKQNSGDGTDFTVIELLLPRTGHGDDSGEE